MSKLSSDFSKQYDKYGNMLYRIAYLYFGSPHDSEDALQEVFIKLLYKAPAFNDDRHEKAWLIRTMQYTCLNMLRKTSGKHTSIDELSLQAKELDNDMHLDVIKAILSLDAKYKAVIILYYYYDYSVDEIARTLKISNSAVKMRLKRGREKLKIDLEGYNYE